MGFVSFKKILPIQEVSPVLFKTIEQAKEFILDNEIEMVDFKMTVVGVISPSPPPVLMKTR